MKGFYIYRYKDPSNNEIVYIGKTLQTSVKDRINQHVTDPVGVWANKNPHIIEFIELPREEDMDYIESYLIRKYVPKYNTILADISKAPPFEIIIKEDLWKNLDDYLKEQTKRSEELQNLSKETISNNFIRLQQIEQEFNSKFNKTIKERIPLIDIEFIKQINVLSINNQTTVSSNFIFKFYGISNNEELHNIFKRLLSYRFLVTSKTSFDNKELFAIFDKIVTNSNNFVTFSFGENSQKITKILQNPWLIKGFMI